jgi:ubiquinol-cytochrome c reductase cytochrome b subunit
MRTVLDWLDDRTGYRAAIRHLLDEQIPRGTGWAFTTGSALLFLLGLQLVTGVALAVYYVPSIVLAYDSVRFITDTLPWGSLLRGLHVWGASFIVVAAVVHLLRVFSYGSYKAPREVTWLTGVVLLFLILAFALTGYLLPWDQKAYWATTVAINIAAGAPLIGGYLADVLRGGAGLGALTLGRWYAVHVFVLPAALVAFIAVHLVLMRRHGISGPPEARAGRGRAFYPWHVARESVVVAVVFTLLLACAVRLPAHLEEIANPADSSYVPRPDWYFLSLFELLKYFPGPWEPVATIVVPGLVVSFLVLLPFIDRGAGRRPLSRGRAPVTLAMMALGVGVLVLTGMGIADLPERFDPGDWGPRSIAGHALATGPDSTCGSCHSSGGPAAELSITRVTKDELWLLGHMADPAAIAPGVRTAADPAPTPVLTRPEAQSVVAYFRRIRAGSHPPASSQGDVLAASTFAASCAGCHTIASEGGQAGPDLSAVGLRYDTAALRHIIETPSETFPGTMMPPFATRLSDAQIAALVQYLSKRR